MTMYQRLLRPGALAALDLLRREQDHTGTTPDDDLDVIVSLMMASRARRILQFGTFLGGSAIVLADIAAQIAEDALLTTVDTDERMNASARRYCDLAGLGDRLETITGSSLDHQLLARLAQREWDLIYLDTTHQYEQTRDEIAAIAPLCSSRTLFVFHDASLFAADTLDVRRLGGVRRALREHVLLHPRWQLFIFERPAFGQYGVGLMQRMAP